MNIDFNNLNKRITSDIFHKDVLNRVINTGDVIAYFDNKLNKISYGVVLNATEEHLKVKTFDNVLNNNATTIRQRICDSNTIIINDEIDQNTLAILRQKLNEKQDKYIHYIFAVNRNNKWFIRFVSVKEKTQLDRLNAAISAFKQDDTIFILNNNMEFEKFQFNVKPFTKLLPPQNNEKSEKIPLILYGGIYYKNNKWGYGFENKEIAFYDNKDPWAYDYSPSISYYYVTYNILNKINNIFNGFYKLVSKYENENKF